jgi:hypothetical protein
MRRKKSSKADAAAAYLRPSNPRPSNPRMEAAPVPSARSEGASLLIRLLARSPLLTALILWKWRPCWPAWFVARLPRPSSDGHGAEIRQTPTPTRAPRR